MNTICHSVREDLTAWIDGELSKAEAGAVDDHLTNCPACASEAQSLRQAVAWQTSVLPQGLLEAPVDVGAMQLNVRRQVRRIRDDGEEAAWTWAWLFRPLALTASAAALALFVVLWGSPEPEPLLVSLGVEPPPAEVSTRPEKFQYLDVIENLDVLEHFEAVQAVRLEDERAEMRGVLKG